MITINIDEETMQATATLPGAKIPSFASEASIIMKFDFSPDSAMEFADYIMQNMIDEARNANP